MLDCGMCMCAREKARDERVWRVTPVLLVEFPLNVRGHLRFDAVLAERHHGKLDRVAFHLLGHVDRLDLRLRTRSQTSAHARQRATGDDARGARLDLRHAGGRESERVRRGVRAEVWRRSPCNRSRTDSHVQTLGGGGALVAARRW